VFTCVNEKEIIDVNKIIFWLQESI